MGIISLGRGRSSGRHNATVVVKDSIIKVISRDRVPRNRHESIGFRVRVLYLQVSLVVALHLMIILVVKVT